MITGSHRHWYLVGPLLTILLWGVGCGGSAIPMDSDPTPADQVSLARMAYDRKDFTEAEKLFKGYLDFNPAGADAGEAHYLLGQIYFRRKEWPSAETEFNIVASQFGGDPRAPDALLFRGLSQWRQSRPAPYDQDYTYRSLDSFDRFLSLYPDHPRAEEALQYRNEARERLAKKGNDTGRLYLKLGYYNPALYWFQKVQKTYPDTDWSLESRLGEAETYIKLGEWYRAKEILQRLLDELPPEDVRREAERLIKKADEGLEKSTVDQESENTASND